MAGDRALRPCRVGAIASAVLAVAACDRPVTYTPLEHPPLALQLVHRCSGFPGELKPQSWVGCSTHYSIDRPYPFDGAFSFYSRQLSHPWQPCESKAGGPLGGGQWTAAPDMVGERPVYVHRKSRAWINRAESRMVVVTASYQSEGATARSAPESTVQVVMVLDDVGDLEDKTRAFGCEVPDDRVG
jgi:hypothetical protein